MLHIKRIIKFRTVVSIRPVCRVLDRRYLHASNNNFLQIKFFYKFKLPIFSIYVKRIINSPTKNFVRNVSKVTIQVSESKYFFSSSYIDKNITFEGSLLVLIVLVLISVAFY